MFQTYKLYANQLLTCEYQNTQVSVLRTTQCDLPIDLPRVIVEFNSYKGDHIDVIASTPNFYMEHRFASSYGGRVHRHETSVVLLYL